jgi:hypothetical protein
MNRFVHADFAKLEAAVLAHSGLARFDDHTMYGSMPSGVELIVDLPTADPYESVDVEFDKEPDEDLLRSLGFPFRSGTDINA